MVNHISWLQIRRWTVQNYPIYKDGYNGLLFGSDMHENVNRIVALMSNSMRYENICGNVLNTAKELSVSNWCQQIHGDLSVRRTEKH